MGDIRWGLLGGISWDGWRGLVYWRSLLVEVCWIGFAVLSLLGHVC